MPESRPFADQPARAAARDEPDAFLLRFLELLVPLRRAQDRHLDEVLERDDRHVARAAADGGAGGVERFLHGRGRLLLHVVDAVRHVVGLAAEPPRRPRRVERDEAAADDDDARGRDPCGSRGSRSGGSRSP